MTRKRRQDTYRRDTRASKRAHLEAHTNSSSDSDSEDFDGPLEIWLSSGQSAVCCERLHTPVHSESSTFFSLPTATCPLLAAVGMSFGQYGFVCDITSSLVPTAHLSVHMEHLHHRQKLRNRTPSTIKSVLVTHLLNSHYLTATTPCPSPPSDLSESIQGLQPEWSSHCPHPGCRHWYAVPAGKSSIKGQQAGTRKHIAEAHPENAKIYLAKVPEMRWIYRPFRKTVHSEDRLFSVVWPFIKDYIPASLAQDVISVRSSRIQYTVSVHSRYLTDLGWQKFIASLGLQPGVLRGLVRLKTKKEALSLEGMEKQLELGLIIIRKLYRSYIVDVQTYISSKNDPQFRQAVTMNTKAHFRSLSRVSYYTYSRPLSRCVCMLIRWIHAERTGALAPFGAFYIRRSLAQEYATNMLYHYLIQTKVPRPAPLLQLLHQLLVTLVKQKFTNLETMACPTDYTLCIGSLADNGGFLLATTTARTCAVLQHNFYTTIIHSARLEDHGYQSFIPFRLDNFTLDPVPDAGEAPQPMEEPAAAPDEGEGADDSMVAQFREVEEEFLDGHDDGIDAEEGEHKLQHEAEAGWDFEKKETFHSYYLNGDTAENLDKYYNPQSSLAAQRRPPNFVAQVDRNPGSLSVLSILAENSHYVQPLLASHPSFATPYNQIKTAWFHSRPTSFKERRNYSFFFTEDGTTITMRDGDDISRSILFSDVGSLAKTTIANISDQIVQCLPHGCKDLLQQFRGISSQLVDDLTSPDAIFLQPSNRILIQPLLDAMLKHLSDPKELNHHIMISPSVITEEAARKWLAFDKRILGQIIVAFLLTCGIPPLHWQFRTFQFQSDSTTGIARNLYLLGSELVIGHPAARQPNQVLQEWLWAFPPSLAPLILFYLAIIRPSVVHITGLLHYVNNDHKTHIFAHTFPTTRLEFPRVWNGSDVNKLLQIHTSSLPVLLSCGLLRNVITAMYNQLFPALSHVGPSDDSMVDRQAQHTRTTGNIHYGRSDHVPFAFGMTLEQARKCMASSQALHAFYGLGSLDHQWAERLQNSAFLTDLRNENLGLKEARILVRETYNLHHCRLPHQIAGLLETAPYLTLKDGVIGDEVLRRVMHAVLFGSSRPNILDRPSGGGYLIADVSTAVVQIVKAVEEVECGAQFHSPRQMDISTIIHFDEVATQAQRHLAALKDDFPTSWMKLCTDVHRLYQKPELSREMSWVVRGVPG
ncbi:uncharacterized protein F5147DRAFT_778759 [Suillus discolor]|uniref:Uncharacterized protein n=1 Tax=Suillus discolor TaxID=1912936 RepID=A0A9P7EYI6_9AGAM|nr:uncharacterized protein F5147DRAFT_778759 [Suillus discolor]KAG2095312.1 hypothetical protein F5147DRAFT_778759 [Suillus discolor]